VFFFNGFELPINSAFFISKLHIVHNLMSNAHKRLLGPFSVWEAFFVKKVKNICTLLYVH